MADAAPTHCHGAVAPPDRASIAARPRPRHPRLAVHENTLPFIDAPLGIGAATSMNHPLVTRCTGHMQGDHIPPGQRPNRDGPNLVTGAEGQQRLARRNVPPDQRLERRRVGRKLLLGGIWGKLTRLRTGQHLRQTGHLVGQRRGKRSAQHRTEIG